MPDPGGTGPCPASATKFPRSVSGHRVRNGESVASHCSRSEADRTSYWESRSQGSAELIRQPTPLNSAHELEIVTHAASDS